MWILLHTTVPNKTKDMVIFLTTIVLNFKHPVEDNIVESKVNLCGKIQSPDGSLFSKPTLSKSLGVAYGNSWYCCCCCRWIFIFKEKSHIITILVYNICWMEQSMWCAFIKEFHMNRKASRQLRHMNCKKVSSDHCCRSNINNDKPVHKQNKHAYVHIIAIFLLTPSFLQSIIDIYDV